MRISFMAVSTVVARSVYALLSYSPSVYVYMLGAQRVPERYNYARYCIHTKRFLLPLPIPLFPSIRYLLVRSLARSR